jgi:hypothetical protein
MCQPCVVVPARSAIPFDLPGDNAGIAVELAGNVGLYEPLIEPAHDAKAFVIAEPVTTPASASQIAGFGQPEIAFAGHQFHTASFAPPLSADIA